MLIDRIRGKETYSTQHCIGVREVVEKFYQHFSLSREILSISVVTRIFVVVLQLGLVVILPSL